MGKAHPTKAHSAPCQVSLSARPLRHERPQAEGSKSLRSACMAGLGVVRSFSPKKIEFAPARKQRACNSSLIASRPAESRTNEAGIMIRATAMVRTNSSGSRGPASASGVPSTRTSILIGTLSGCSGKLASAEHGGAILDAFPHTQDAATADMDARFPHMGQCVEPVLVGARCNDPVVIRLGGVEVMVVIVQARFLEPLDLRWCQHAEGRGRSQAQGLHAGDQFGDVGDVIIARRPPGRSHAKSRRAGEFGCSASASTASFDISFCDARPVSKCALCGQ